MASVVHKRKEAAYLKSVSQIINEELNNTNVSYTTITSVKLSNDSSHLNVYVVFENQEERSLEYLNRSKGFIRTRLSSAQGQRKVPELHFVLDETEKNANRIEEILKKIKSEQ